MSSPSLYNNFITFSTTDITPNDIIKDPQKNTSYVCFTGKLIFTNENGEMLRELSVVYSYEKLSKDFKAEETQALMDNTIEKMGEAVLKIVNQNPNQQLSQSYNLGESNGCKLACTILSDISELEREWTSSKNQKKLISNIIKNKTISGLQLCQFLSKNQDVVKLIESDQDLMNKFETFRAPDIKTFLDCKGLIKPFSPPTSVSEATTVTQIRLSPDDLKSLLGKISTSTNQEPSIFVHNEEPYVIWKAEVNGKNVINIQRLGNWNSGEPGENFKEKLGFSYDSRFNIPAPNYIDNKPADPIPTNRLHLVEACKAYARQTEAPVEVDEEQVEVKEAAEPEIFTQQQLAISRKIREPLTKELQKYFNLNPFGYILNPKSGIAFDKIQTELEKNEAAFANLFYQVSSKGDSAYAEDIRTTLAGMNIASTPVDKDAVNISGKPHNTDVVRPATYVKSKSKAAGTKEPGRYTTKKRNDPAYLSAWENAIWKGYRDYRHKADGNYKDADQPIKAEHLMDYQRRIEAVRKLHQEGFLLGRVANTQEVNDFIGHRYHMGNDILSTTLWPKEKDPLVMQLFSEYGADTVGVLLDHTRIGQEDFGVSFQSNAVTVGQGFQRHKGRIKGSKASNPGGMPGANSIHAQKGLLEALSNAIKEGGSINGLNITLSEDGSHYQVKKMDVRLGGAGGKNKKILWNEQTFYRGAERSFFTGLFVKSDSDNFSKELKQLFELQERIRQKKGLYVPIFQFKGATNELEELVPDRLLLNITGAKNVTPIEGRESRLSRELQKAGIDTDMAFKMSKAIAAQGVGTVKSLFELQLLMFNMKDIMGKMTIPVPLPDGGTSYEAVRILDNLHLVFPTIHKTQNTEAKNPDLFFSDADIKSIKNPKTPELTDYLKSTLTHNLSRFLGISVNKSGVVKFDIENVDLFDKKDTRKLDFAKVLSRAMQSVVLFQTYGKDTNKIVLAIAGEIRKQWPHLGVTPGGIDMILGSEEMQAILKKTGFNPNELSKKLEPAKKPSAVVIEVPPPPSTDNVDPYKAVNLPTKEEMETFLAKLGIKKDGSIDRKIFDSFKNSDPHLLAYETALLQTIPMLHVIGAGALAIKIMENIRAQHPEFGFTVTHEDNSLPKNDLLMQWLQEAQAHQPHQTEFPFNRKIQASASAATSGTPLMGRRGRGMPVDEDDLFVGRGRGMVRAPASARSGGAAAVSNQPKLDNKTLQQLEKERHLIPPFSPSQLKAAKRLGLVDSTQNPLWTIEPTFHEGDKGKPKKAYIEVQDILGHNIAHLMTGPALDPSNLKNDRNSFELAISPMIPKDQVEHLVTDTLAVTTEGDKQVLRPNGLQYSRAILPPYGGNIEFNGGNEKHGFRSNDARHYYRSPSGQGYNGAGAYTDKDLKIVEDLDSKLLSDSERRIKRMGMLASSYVTVTAEGGYGAERKPLSQAHRVLYMATAGAQFEKYNRGAFKYQNGKIDENELEATDFIIKKAAAAQKTPLFPHYYSQTNGVIPAHGDIQSVQVSKLDDGDFSKPYVELLDGALFNREAFKKANDDYLLELVIPNITQRTKGEPIYLKAILLGGGFFAQTDNAGNLRSEVINATLSSYIKAIDSGLIPPGSAIEFPRYGEESTMPAGLVEELKRVASRNKIEIIWTPNGDVCDFNAQTSMSGNKVDIKEFESRGCLVALGAADAMSWHGNEPSSSSLESAFANNSNLRLVMNWWANPKVLDVVNQMT